MAVSSSKKIGVSAHIESVYGTFPTFDHTKDALLMYENPNPLKVDGARQSLQPIRPSLTQRKDAMGRVLQTFNGVTYLQGPESLTAPVAPWRFGMLLRACGFSQTINTGPASIVYVPVSDNYESVSLDVYLDGYRHKMPGCFGTFTMEAAAGEYVKATFDMTGLYQDPVVAAIPTQTFELDQAPAFKSAACTIATEVVVLKSFRLQWGLQIAERRDANAPDGMKGLFIAARAPTLNMVVEVDTTLRNYFNDIFKTQTTHAVVWQVGTTAGNRVKFSVPQGQPIDNPYGESEQLRTFDVNYKVQHQTDNAELSITFD